MFVVISYHPTTHFGVVWENMRKLEKYEMTNIRETGQKPELNLPKPGVFLPIFGHGHNLLLGKTHVPFFINQHITADQWDLIEADAKRTNKLHFLENIIATNVSNLAEAKKIAMKGLNEYEAKVKSGMLSGGAQTKPNVKEDEITPVVNAPRSEIEKLKAEQIDEAAKIRAKAEMKKLEDNGVVIDFE